VGPGEVAVVSALATVAQRAEWRRDTGHQISERTIDAILAAGVQAERERVLDEIGGTKITKAVAWQLRAWLNDADVDRSVLAGVDDLTFDVLAVVGRELRTLVAPDAPEPGA
jgi:hypothetical protein